METDDILCADCRICISEDESAMDRLLAAIEVEEGKSGFIFNRAKCEYLSAKRNESSLKMAGTPHFCMRSSTSAAPRTIKPTQRKGDKKKHILYDHTQQATSILLQL